MKKTKIYRNILILIVAAYVIFTLLSQQQTLAQYDSDKAELQNQIAEQEDYKANLEEQKNNVNSLNFIEETAREKLDMYLPNEKVYINQ